MDEFQSERQQIDELKRWWSENGRYVITGLVLGVGVLGGLKFWNDHKAQLAIDGGSYFGTLSDAVRANETATVEEMSALLADRYGSTPYADHASLALARFHMENEEPEKAVAELQRLVDESRDEQLVHIARLRLARVLVHLQRAEEALALLTGVDTGGYAARYHEVRGDVHFHRGDVDAARAEYQAALDNFVPGLIDRRFVEMKLHDLTPAAGEVSSLSQNEVEPGA